MSPLSKRIGMIDHRLFLDKISSGMINLNVFIYDELQFGLAN